MGGCAPAAQFHWRVVKRPDDSGACRGERFVLREDVPDGFGELDGRGRPGRPSRRAGGPDVASCARSARCKRDRGQAWVAASMSAQRRYLGPFLASGPRSSLAAGLAHEWTQPGVPGQLLGAGEAA